LQWTSWWIDKLLLFRLLRSMYMSRMHYPWCKYHIEYLLNIITTLFASIRYIRTMMSRLSVKHILRSKCRLKNSYSRYSKGMMTLDSSKIISSSGRKRLSNIIDRKDSRYKISSILSNSRSSRKRYNFWNRMTSNWMARCRL